MRFVWRIVHCRDCTRPFGAWVEEDPDARAPRACATCDPAEPFDEPPRVQTLKPLDYYDRTLGAHITSRRQRDRLADEKGVVNVSGIPADELAKIADENRKAKRRARRLTADQAKDVIEKYEARARYDGTENP